MKIRYWTNLGEHQAGGRVLRSTEAKADQNTEVFKADTVTDTGSLPYKGKACMTALLWGQMRGTYVGFLPETEAGRIA